MDHDFFPFLQYALIKEHLFSICLKKLMMALIRYMFLVFHSALQRNDIKTSWTINYNSLTIY